MINILGANKSTVFQTVRQRSVLHPFKLETSQWPRHQ